MLAWNRWTSTKLCETEKAASTQGFTPTVLQVYMPHLTNGWSSQPCDLEDLWTSDATPIAGLRNSSHWIELYLQSSTHHRRPSVHLPGIAFSLCQGWKCFTTGNKYQQIDSKQVPFILQLHDLGFSNKERVCQHTRCYVVDPVGISNPAKVVKIKSTLLQSEGKDEAAECCWTVWVTVFGTHKP